MTADARLRDARPPGPGKLALLLTLALLLCAPGARAGAQTPTDSAEALEAFHRNVAAIHQRDRARYLSVYLQSDRLVRAGPDGVQRGYEGLEGSAGESWPDTLVASHFRVTPVADGVAYGAYRYRLVQGDLDQRGVSERLLVRTDEGWRVAVTTAFPAPDDQPPPPFALTGANLVDGTGADPVENANVVMRDGRIACAGPAGECPVPDDAEVVDASGRWITPGLVDAHVHYSQTGWADGRPDSYDARDRFPYPETVRELEENPERFFRSYLCSGVTATFDVGGFPWTWDLRERSEETTDAPHVAAAGPLLSTRDHWVELPAEEQFLHLADAEATRAAADYLVANETDAVKVWYLVGRESPDTAHFKEMMRIGARTAREAGTPLIVHATGLWQAKDALRAGADLLVHSVYDQPVDGEFLALARRSGVIYTPTLIVSQGYQQLGNRNFLEHRYDLECVDPATRRKAFLTDSLPNPPSAEEMARRARQAEERYRLMLRNLERVHAAGIPVAMGTDAGNPLTLHGPSVYLEMEAMAEAGMSPMEILRAATVNGARAMGRADDFGTVEEGKIADLLVLDENPLADVSNFRSVALVVRRGEIRTRDELAYPDGG